MRKVQIRVLDFERLIDGFFRVSFLTGTPLKITSMEKS